MRHMTTVFLMLFVLAGCGHKVHLTHMPTGTTAEGRVPFSLGYNGDMNVNIEGVEYTGRWVVVAGGSAGVGFFDGSAGTGTSLAMGSQPGNGKALLRSKNGDCLKCIFQYSTWSSSGMGTCTDDEGREWEMMVD